MSQIPFNRLTTPGAFKPRSVLIACFLAMALIFVLDLITPADIRLHILYIFPMVAIALHCERKSVLVAALALSTIFQSATFFIQGVPTAPLATDSLIAFAAALLATFLARSVRANHFATVKLATTDWLTGLHNRRSMEDIIGLEIERQKRYGGIFSLVAIDLDGFKKLNDSRGHEAGDVALRLVADTLQEHTRHSDSIARLGGDEYAILMPNTRKPACNSLCQQLSVKIASRMSAAGFPITASIGSATFEQIPESTTDVFQKADKAMYAAKAGGKNCVVGLYHLPWDQLPSHDVTVH